MQPGRPPTPPRDDRVLRGTRWLSATITPFLLVAFVLLYLFPADTRRLFAWTITPTMTPMVLASAYLGGAYFFLRVLREPRWSVVATGFAAVTLFATLLAVATVVHWDRFNHAHPAFWVWAALYFTAPVLVLAAWLANRRYAAAPRADEPTLGPVAATAVGLVGLVAVVQGAVMFLAPARMIAVWPWTLTPLTCRVVGAVLCLGAAGVGVLADRRWTSVRLMLQVELVMVVLMLVAAVRARSEIDTTRPLTWLLLGGFLSVLVGSVYLWARFERAGGRTTPKPATARRRST